MRHPSCIPVTPRLDNKICWDHPPTCTRQGRTIWLRRGLHVWGLDNALTGALSPTLLKFTAISLFFETCLECSAFTTEVQKLIHDFVSFQFVPRD